jgi:hypothetical protein
VVDGDIAMTRPNAARGIGGCGLKRDYRKSEDCTCE